MTALVLQLPAIVEPAEFEAEVVVSVADRLRDDHGYSRSPGSPGADGDEHRYHLVPNGSIAVVRGQGRMVVRLHGIDVDARDLFTGVSSELEQRHDGLAVEIE
ncbi:hypothetical protein H7K45_28755 [Mycobacterium yunnanensis]|uniref:Uncharacterized protein n=1 Tax=Mycobacterium yunnanensis TaxID=368477 RepID=A0A9X2Z7I3_9MYCO|nr:hypothetical protein [Mycobacterium yunnanensis]MCV7424540.1 hypothetical protein [Mycobacterium yunnanensis]